MNLTILSVVTGSLRENCFIVQNRNREALIIDPGADGDRIQSVIEEHALHPIAVINTHGHYDHVGAVKAMMDAYSIPFYMHGGDTRLLKSANILGTVFALGPKIEIPSITHKLEDTSETFALGNFEIRWLHTPGHTPGGVCFRIAENLFTGDTLLPGSVGRTDLPGGDASALGDSLERISTLPADLKLYPGHGRSDTLGQELERNRKFATAINRADISQSINSEN